MMSTKILQNTINEISQITGLNAALWDLNGNCLCCTASVHDKMKEDVCGMVDSEDDARIYETYILRKVMIEEVPEYILAIQNGRSDAEILSRMAVCQIRNLVLGSREQLDRNRFIANIAQGMIRTTEIRTRARRFHIEDRKRIVIVIDSAGKDAGIVLELVKNLTKTGDYVFSANDSYTVLVREIAENERNPEKAAHTAAQRLMDTISMEAMLRIRIGISGFANTLEEIQGAYQQAVTALKVGSIFYQEKLILSYSHLGIGRLVDQLPEEICRMFIKEVFGDTLPEILSDEESMSTINRFFDNNLNISETARQLYVHRNTLVYRLERIQKALGLDIRNFEDAIMFRMAMMVLAHLRDSK